MNTLPSMVPFHTRFPDVAWPETRSVSVYLARQGLPVGEYAFVEYFCNEPGCDCRRVLFKVVSKSQPGEILAVINFGWEAVAFYTRWLHGDEEGANEIVAAALDPLNRQSRHAPALLDLFRKLWLPDQDYVARQRRHYELFKRGGKRGRAKRH